VDRSSHEAGTTPAIPRKPWLQENAALVSSLAAAVFSLFGVVLSTNLTSQSHAIDVRLKSLEDKTASAQTFQQRVFDNVEKLLSQKPQAARLYLIGLYGQARDDEESKSLVASIAAASCSADLLRTLQALTSTESPEERKKLKVLILNMTQSATCVAAGTPVYGSQGTKVATTTPAPETVAARSALVASLTEPDAVGWIQIGTAPNGTETKPCIILEPDAGAIVDVVGPDGKATRPLRWGPKCALAAKPIESRVASGFNIVTLPRADSEKQEGVALHLRVDRTLYSDHATTSPATGLAKADSTVTLVAPKKSDAGTGEPTPIKGIDSFDGGTKKYSVWAYVRVETSAGSNFSAPSPGGSTVSPLPSTSP
jgi:hypothetical protein